MRYPAKTYSRGTVFIELLVACALTTVLLTLSVQLLGITGLERRQIERRAIARQEAANLLERMSVIPYAELTSERLAELKLSSDITKLLPQVHAEWTLTEEPGDLPTKRVAIEITWIRTGKQTDAPVRLTSWAFEAPQVAVAEPIGDPEASQDKPSEEPPPPAVMAPADTPDEAPETPPVPAPAPAAEDAPLPLGGTP